MAKDCNTIPEFPVQSMSFVVERKALTPIPTCSTTTGMQKFSLNRVSCSRSRELTHSDSDDETYPLNSLTQIEWFHPNMNRSMASAFLKTHNLEGSYLLRPSDSLQNPDNELYTLSVWSGGGAFEFPVKFNVATLNLEYGLHVYTIEEFKAHFRKFPRIGRPNLALILKYPMERNINEPHEYEVYNPASFGKENSTLERFKESIFKIEESDISGSYSPIYKAGFLHKRGHIRKNWKRRWFVLDRRELSYYTGRPSSDLKCNDAKLIRTLDLAQVLWLEEKEHKYKQKFCFTLYFPGIIYSMYAYEQDEYEAWVSLLKRALKLPSYINSSGNRAKLS